MNDRRASQGAVRSGDAPSVGLQGRRLLLVRVVWVAVAALILGLDAAGVPYAYELYKEVCTGESCIGLLTPDGSKALHEMGLSEGFFAGYAVAVQIAVLLVFAVVSAVIFWRGPNDTMALFTSFTLLVFGGAAFTSDVPQSLVAAHPALWLPFHLLYYAGQVSFLIFFYIFPDGRFAPGWTRWLAIAAALLWVPAAFFQHSFLDILSGPFFFVVIITTVVAQVYRYRRVSSPEQRQQTKWVVFGTVVAIVGFSAVVILIDVVPSVPQSGPLLQMAIVAVMQGAITLIPLSIGVAILRSRLYDIDVVINRTVVYTLLTVTLTLVYFCGVVVLQYAFRALTGGESQLAVVASTLAIAALFGPLRRRIQAFIDRRFYRRKYNAERVLATFSSRLRDETDLDRLSEELLVVVRETVQPAHASLWLRGARERT